MSTLSPSNAAQLVEKGYVVLELQVSFHYQILRIQ